MYVHTLLKKENEAIVSELWSGFSTLINVIELWHKNLVGAEPPLTTKLKSSIKTMINFHLLVVPDQKDKIRPQLQIYEMGQ